MHIHTDRLYSHTGYDLTSYFRSAFIEVGHTIDAINTYRPKHNQNIRIVFIFWKIFRASAAPLLNKIIASMVIRPIDDPIYKA